MNRAIYPILFIVLLSLPASVRAQLDPLPVPLKLPPGLVQNLPLEKSTSYFGDALRAVHCPDDKDNPFGTCGNLLFGGLAMVNSHLSGKIQIEFFPPVNNIAHFEVMHPGGLAGDDSFLTAPNAYRLPAKGNLVYDDYNVIGSGDLNLVNGEVTNFKYAIHFANTALLALVNANPKLEAPLLKFPGSRGSAWAKFEQRSDGLLDFTFYGTTFLPLGNSIKGDPVRLPLGLCNFPLNCSTIPAAGTSLHPQLHLSTKPITDPDCGQNCPDIPYNTIQHYSTNGWATYFGDKFTLNIPELGGGAIGRSHLLGRLQIQFGEPSGGSVPFAVSSMPPAALLAEPPASPLSFPGLAIGLLGHDEYLRFPLQTYSMVEVAEADEPFDLQLGSIDLRTGRVIGDLVYRGFIAQNIIFQVLAQNDGRIAPDPWNFRGPSSFEKGVNGQNIFRFQGTVRAPFTGFRFPSPDLIKAHSWVAGEGSYLDPYMTMQAMSTPSVIPSVKSGSATAVSSRLDTFTYSYTMPCDPAGQPFSFQYTNNNSTKGGTFKMNSLANVHCFNSRTGELGSADYDVVTFSGFGSWSTDKDNGLHFAAVQVSTAPNAPYVSVTIDAGYTSNAHTKPAFAPVP